MSQVRCAGCGSWFSSGLAGCEECGRERPAWNRALHVARLNTGLFKQAEQAVAEEKTYRRSLGEERRMAKRLGQPFVEPQPLTRRDLGRA